MLSLPLFAPYPNLAPVMTSNSENVYSLFGGYVTNSRFSHGRTDGNLKTYINMQHNSHMGSESIAYPPISLARFLTLPHSLSLSLSVCLCGLHLQ